MLKFKILFGRLKITPEVCQEQKQKENNRKKKKLRKKTTGYS
jgi:hypothetical protein